MDKRRRRYLDRQKAFWNTEDEQAARFTRIYTDNTRSEDRWQKNAEQATARMLEGFRPEAGCTLLEIGCGNGRLMSEISRRVPFEHFIGVDLSDSMIRFARKNLGSDPRFDLRVNSGGDLNGVPDGSVDFVYANDVFIHIFDYTMIAGYFLEIHRVLKENGLFRFNVTRFDPDQAFGDSLGGHFAKWMHKLGIYSAGFHRWAPSQNAEFNGNQFTPREIRRALRDGLFPARKGA